jgi:hypothetical protein
MGFKRFSLLSGVYPVLIMLSLLALTYLLCKPGYHAATLLLVFLLVLQCYSIFNCKFIARTNAELVRFLEVARHADYSQRFDLSGTRGSPLSVGIFYIFWWKEISPWNVNYADVSYIRKYPYIHTLQILQFFYTYVYYMTDFTDITDVRPITIGIYVQNVCKVCKLCKIV